MSIFHSIIIFIDLYTTTSTRNKGLYFLYYLNIFKALQSIFQLDSSNVLDICFTRTMRITNSGVLKKIYDK